MTVSTEISSNEYTGNGVTTDFDYKFRIFKANQLSVITSDADGDNVVTLRLGTDYTVTGANKSAGGKVILTRPLADKHKISIARDIPITQETSFRNQSKFFAETHENAFDYLTMILQSIWGSLGSLYLKRPNILANWFDAKGYRIANLGKPKRDSDAVDLGTLDNELNTITQLITGKEKRMLRVDDVDIPSFPESNIRKNKQIGFDSEGLPTLLDPIDTGSLGYVLVDSFEKGAVLTGRFQVLFWEERREYFRWDGKLPKVVMPDSTPNETGGIKTNENPNGLWVSVGDGSLRTELGIVTKTYNTFSEMKSDASIGSDELVRTLGYYTPNDGGGADYVITSGVEECVGICPKLPSGNVAVLKNEFSVKALSCGVRFNGVASEDNTTKYENAANYCAKKQLLLTYPKGKFVASRDITVTGAIQDAGVQGFSRDQIHSWIHMNGFTLNRIGANTRTEGVVFTSNGRNNTPRENPILKHIHTSPLSHADVDAYYYNCNILESFNLVHITGRGITFTNCNLSVFTYAVSLHWQEGHDPSATDPERTNEQGMRVYVFNGCRFHGAINGYIIENRGFNKLNTRGLALNDCYIDTGCGYIIGSMHDFNISVTHLHANRKLFELADGDELVNGVLSGVIKGRVNAAAENGGALERVIEQRGDTSRIDGVTISANIERISQAAYSLSGIVGELTITGHHRDIGRDNGINGAQNMFIDATRVKEYTGSVVLTGGSAMFSDPSKAYEYATNGVPDGVLMVNSFKTNVRDLTSHSIRGRNGDISRHTFTGDGTGTRQIQLPANAMYCLIYVIDGNNGGRSLIAIDTRFGGVGDAVIRNDNILEVKGIFNTSSIHYIYIVHY